MAKERDYEAYEKHIEKMAKEGNIIGLQFLDQIKRARRKKEPVEPVIDKQIETVQRFMRELAKIGRKVKADFQRMAKEAGRTGRIIRTMNEALQAQERARGTRGGNPTKPASQVFDRQRAEREARERGGLDA